MGFCVETRWIELYISIVVVVAIIIVDVVVLWHRLFIGLFLCYQTHFHSISSTFRVMNKLILFYLLTFAGDVPFCRGRIELQPNTCCLHLNVAHFFLCRLSLCLIDAFVSTTIEVNQCDNVSMKTTHTHMREILAKRRARNVLPNWLTKK